MKKIITRNLCFAIFFLANFSLFASIDLELSISTTTPNPNQWSFANATLLLTNNGTEPATNVVVEFKKSNLVVYAGGNEYMTSQGSFSPYGNERWIVGSISAGSFATLEVEYFVNTSDSFSAYAQVWSASQTDSDSTPGNGVCCMSNEDDEANFSFNSGGGNPICTGNLTLSGQSQVDNFGLCTTFNGDLTIKGNVTNLQSLTSLIQVTGKLFLENVSGLQNLNGLQNLQSVGALIILSCPNLTDLNALSNLNSIQGRLVINNNDALQNVIGLGGIQSVGSFLEMDDNDNLVSVDGLNNLQSIGTNLRILNNPILQNVDAFSNLQNIGEDLFFDDNFQLNECCGLFPLLNSGTVGGVTIFSNQPSGCASATDILNNCQGAVPCTMDLQISNVVCMPWVDPGITYVSFDYIVTGTNLDPNGTWTAQWATDVGPMGIPIYNTVIGDFNTPYTSGVYIFNNETSVELTFEESSISPECSDTEIINCPTGGGDCDDISISTGAGSISISGANAPHVLMKIFRPNWSTALDCLDNCSNPEVVTGLGAGQHFVEIKLLDDNWGEICKINEFVQVSAPMPLVGNQFYAYSNVESVDLVWMNNFGKDIADFEVERSTNGSDFGSILVQNSQEKNGWKYYKGEDPNPEMGINFYRLKMNLTNGEIHYSNIQIVEIEDIPDFEIFPNPASEYVNINLENIENSVVLKLVNFQGIGIREIILDAFDLPIYRLDLSDFENGLYSILIEENGRKPVSKRLVIARH